MRGGAGQQPGNGGPPPPWAPWVAGWPPPGSPSGAPPPGRRSRHRWLAALLALAAVLELCVGVVGLTRLRSADRPAAPLAGATGAPRAAPAPVPPTADADADRLTAVRTMLTRRAAALLRRDRAGWLAGIDPRASSFRSKQADLFDNLAGVPLASWEYAVADHASRPLAAAARRRYREPTWAPVVTLRYSLRAVDADPTDRPQVLTFVQRTGRWYLASDADEATDGTRTWRGLWDFGRVVSRRGRSSLVLAHPAHTGRLGTLADAVDAAVPRVSAIWGSNWPRQVAVLIPDTSSEMSQLVGSKFALARIAAVATADFADPKLGQARGQRVVVNPANLGRLGSLGLRIVLQHEITHVASRAVTGNKMPTWLVEGFADYVGYRDSGLPAAIIAQELRSQLRRHTWPGRLPADADFRGDAPRLAVAYEESWFACVLIARRVGAAGLVRLYRLVGTNVDRGAAALGDALRAVLKMSTGEFVAMWKRAAQAEFG